MSCDRRLAIRRLGVSSHRATVSTILYCRSSLIRCATRSAGSQVGIVAHAVDLHSAIPPRGCVCAGVARAHPQRRSHLSEIFGLAKACPTHVVVKLGQPRFASRFASRTPVSISSIASAYSPLGKNEPPSPESVGPTTSPSCGLLTPFYRSDNEVANTRRAVITVENGM